MNDYLQTKELYHHGIKGQRWGVRRYQNEDGTLTDAGRIGSVSMKFLNTNERSIFKQQMAREYLRTLMYNDEKFYKKNN